MLVLQISMPALSVTWKGPRTSPHLHMRTLRWYKPNLTCVPDTTPNHHPSPPPPNTNRTQGWPTPPRILHTNHTHKHPSPYLLRWLQSPYFNTLHHTVFCHIYCVKHDDEISTSTIHIIISLLDPTLQTWWWPPSRPKHVVSLTPC